MDIAKAIAAVAAQYGMDRFTRGDCHTLAVALFDSCGAQGELSACLRNTLNADGSVFATGYSHMVYVCQEGRNWDIGGDDADLRWEEAFPDLGEPDNWGMTEALEWVAVPYVGHQEWLLARNARVNHSLCNELKAIIREAEAVAVELLT